MTTSSITIRRFQPDEAELWRAIRLEALGNAPEAFGQTHEHALAQPLEAFRETVSGRFPPFVALADTAPIGSAGFYVMGGKMAHRGVLWGMYVAPAWRGKGVGQRLIGCVIESARQWGNDGGADGAAASVLQVHLHVVTTNTAAYELYRRMGFVAHGVEPRALHHAGRYFDETMMVRFLDQPAAGVMP